MPSGDRNWTSRIASGVLGRGPLERFRSATLALLGLSAAAGLALVGVALDAEWPLATDQPVPVVRTEANDGHSRRPAGSATTAALTKVPPRRAARAAPTSPSSPAAPAAGTGSGSRSGLLTARQTSPPKPAGGGGGGAPKRPAGDSPAPAPRAKAPAEPPSQPTSGTGRPAGEEPPAGETPPVAVPSSSPEHPGKGHAYGKPSWAGGEDRSRGGDPGPPPWSGHDRDDRDDHGGHRHDH